MNTFLVLFLLLSSLNLFLSTLALNSNKRYLDFKDLSSSTCAPREIDHTLFNSPPSQLSSLFKSIDDVLHSLNFFLSSSQQQQKQQQYTNFQDSEGLSRLPSNIHVRETDAERIFFLDLPGFHRSEVHVDLVRDRLISVKAERECASKDAYCITRSIDQVLDIGDDIDAKKVTVNLDAGELRIHLPKHAANRWTIPIVDRIFGLNRPSHDFLGEKVPVHTLKSIPFDPTDIEYTAWLYAKVDPSNPENYNRYMTAVRETTDKVSETIKESKPGQWIHDANKDAHHVEDSVAENIKQKAQTAGHQISKSSEHVHESVKQAAEHARDSFLHTADDLKHGVHSATEDAKDKLESVKRTTANAKDSIKENIKDNANGFFGWFGDNAAGIHEAKEGFKHGKEEHKHERQLKRESHRPEL